MNQLEMGMNRLKSMGTNALRMNWLGYKMNSYRHCHKSTSCCLSDEWEDTALISMEAVNHKSSSLCQRQGSYLGFWETAHLPLPRAKCWLRGGVGGQVTQRQYQSLIDYVCDDAGYQSPKVVPMCFQEALDMTYGIYISPFL